MTRLKLKVFTAVFCCGLWSHAQIKIGDHPEQIAPGSVLELESEKRVLVITRVSTGQMNEISPLAGALAFNTDTGCIHFFDGAAWRNLCESPGLLLSAEPKVNPFPTLLLTPDEAGLHLEVSEISGEQVADFSIGRDDLKNGAVTAEKLDSLSVGDAAMDYGAITLNDFKNDAGYVRREELVSQDPGNSLAERGGVFYDDSDLRTAVEKLASDFEKDLDRDAANELQQLTLANGLLSISDGNSVDLSPVLGTGTDSQNLLGAGLSGTTLEIDIERGASVSVDLDPGFVSETEWADFRATDRDLDPANELQTISSSDGSVRITPSGKDFDLSVSGGGTDDQDLTSATLAGTDLTISIENGAAVTADLSALATDAELAALPLDDADADPTNELQSLSSPDGSLTVQRIGNDYELSVTAAGAGSNLANSNLIQTGGDRVYDLAGQNLSFDGSGSVGIGTLSPQSKLHVSGQIRSSGYANSNGVVGEPSYAFTNDSDTGMWRGSRVNYLRFSTGGVEALTIDPNQNVGIGVDSPTERLEVAGNILASGSVTPDYVFDTYYGGGSAGAPSYKFRKLEEVEAYLRRHRHLPGVPSAREVAKAGGILVNRATEVNLEKIEELYLYLLEQQQQLRSLQNEYKLLASQVLSLKKQNPVQP